MFPVTRRRSFRSGLYDARYIDVCSLAPCSAVMIPQCSYTSLRGVINHSDDVLGLTDRVGPEEELVSS